MLQSIPIHFGPLRLTGPIQFTSIPFLSISDHVGPFGPPKKQMGVTRVWRAIQDTLPPGKIYHWERQCAENDLCSFVQDIETVLPTLWQCPPSKGA